MNMPKNTPLDAALAHAKGTGIPVYTKEHQAETERQVQAFNEKQPKPETAEEPEDVG